MLIHYQVVIIFSLTRYGGGTSIGPFLAWLFMRILRSFVLQVPALIGLGLLAGWGLSHRGATEEISDGKYEFDSRLDPPLPAQARVDPGQHLVVMVGLTKFSPPAQYLGVLQRKYQSDGLKILVVFAPDAPRSHAALADSMGVPWVVDKDGSYRRVLRSALGHGHDALLIYDKNYKVKFQAFTNPDNDALRQLVEKYLLGRITYSPAELLASDLIGKRMEGLECLRERAKMTGVFVIFPPGCSSCELNGYRESLTKARVSGWGSSANRDPWTLVFVNGLDGNTAAIAKNLGFGGKSVCGVREDKLLDPYQTRKGATMVPLLVSVGDDEIVKDVQKLTTVSKGGAQ